jgi:hypothetical protein
MSVAVNQDRNNIFRPVEEWTVITDAIFNHNPKAISFRDTDHEYRTDSRDITSYGGRRMDLPIDCLGVKENAEINKKLLQDMLNYYFRIKDGERGKNYIPAKPA